MSLEEAIAIANGRSRHVGYHWYVYPLNNGYAIASTSEVRKHGIAFVYGTGNIDIGWVDYKLVKLPKQKRRTN